MSLVFILYLIGILPAVNGVFLFSTAVLVIMAIIGTIVTCDTKETEDEKNKLRKRFIYPKSAVFCLLVLALTPSRETAYTMLAAYGVESLAANERVQELGGKSLDVLEKAMNDYLEEGK